MKTEILILGAGCAGLTAGMYAARAGRKVVILERKLPGGQAALTGRIDNYPGLPGIDGVTLTECMVEQAKGFGADVICCEVQSVDLAGKRVQTDQGEFYAPVLILATGAEPRKLGIPGEEKFAGRGVSYCATCDGFFYRDKTSFVIGGGNSAGEEALHLASIGSRVRMLVRRGEFRCEAAIAEQVMHEPNIEVLFHREVLEIRGEDSIQSLLLRNTETEEVWEESAKECGIFIFAGYRPATRMFRGMLALDESEAILTDEHLQTGLPGVYAAGDVRKKDLRQMVTATADGALAAFYACKSFQNMLSSD